jgi:hypothetical protein
MNQSSIWPACLPKAKDQYLEGGRGILAGWIEPLPIAVAKDQTDGLTSSYFLKNLWQRQSLYELTTCSDPKWMNSSTYYPAGTACYRGVAWASTVLFGMSGSGIVRPFLDAETNSTRFSWAGPLSMSKGTDYLYSDPFSSRIAQFSSNPAVFTDAICYLDWIAAQYNLSLPASFEIPQYCSQSRGDKADFNNTSCLSREYTLPNSDCFQQEGDKVGFGVVSCLAGSRSKYSPATSSNPPAPCNFSAEYPKCKLNAHDPDLRPANSYNFFTCLNENNQPALCANNCPGVDANAVVVGGLAITTSVTVGASIAAGPDLLGASLGAGSILAIAGLGGVAARNMTACPRGQCRARFMMRCCEPVLTNGRSVCPLFCN